MVLPHIWKILMPIGMDLEKNYMNGYVLVSITDMETHVLEEDF